MGGWEDSEMNGKLLTRYEDLLPEERSSRSSGERPSQRPHLVKCSRWVVALGHGALASAADTLTGLGRGTNLSSPGSEEVNQSEQGLHLLPLLGPQSCPVLVLYFTTLEQCQLNKWGNGA